MGLFDFLKGKKEEAQAPTLPVIHDVTFGRTVTIDPLIVNMLGAQHRFSMPTPSLTITGQGSVKFEDGVWLHRFYTDDHMLLQITGGDGVNSQDVQDISVFSVYDSKNPSSKTALSTEINRLKAATYTLDGVDYERVWFDGDDPADPVQFYETVYLDETGSEHYGIQQSCMLFSRMVDDTEENLLVTYEKTSQGDESITQMVGITISPNDLHL